MNGIKKKVLSIAHWFPNENNPSNGIFIKKHLEAIDSITELLIVDFSISYSKSIYTKKVFRSKNDLKILHIHIKSRFYKYLYYSLIFQTYILNKALKKEKISVDNFDLIVSNVIFPSGIIGYKLANKYKKPLILIEHWSYFGAFLKKDIHRKKGVKTLEYTDSIIVVSEILKSIVIEYCNPEKVMVIPNIISNQFQFLKSKELIDNTISFLAISSWKKPKNPFFYINALEELTLKKIYPKFKLILIGEGPQLDEIKEMKLNFSIEYIGNVKNEELPNYFENANYFLHGSDFETFSIVGIEALMTGTPVICSPVGVLNEVINESNGIICENNIESWKIGIEKAFKTEYDFDEIAEGQKDKFTKEHVTSLFKKVLN